jgi:mannose-6-phosphate isomerase-like protein (cupin superfamily)
LARKQQAEDIIACYVQRKKMMIHRSADLNVPKGWFIGPWNSDVPIPIGYANTGVDEPHLHEQMFEVYLVARGWSTAVLNSQTVTLNTGDMLVVEPGEVHTFTNNSDDYLHFVIHTPFVKGDKVVI